MPDDRFGDLWSLDPMDPQKGELKIVVTPQKFNYKFMNLRGTLKKMADLENWGEIQPNLSVKTLI